MLIFTSWRTGDRSSIFVADDDGSDLHRLTSRYRLRHYQRLRISPDHRRLLFLAVPYGEERGRFFCWERGSDRLTVFEQEEPYPYDLRWLTDDKLLCCREGKYWTADLASAELTDLAFMEGYLAIDVAPDGNRVLLKEGSGIGGSIYVGDLERRRIQEIVRGEEYERSHAIVYPSSWSPDGRAIACVGGCEDEVWLVDADGANPHKVAETDYFWREIRWSPDGNRIAFTRGLDGGGPTAERAAVLVVDLSSGAEAQVLTVRRSERWRWSLDGHSMVYAQSNDDRLSLLRIELQSGRIAKVIGPLAGLKDIDELIVV
jgi:Tol biopolymer transport system component